LKKLKNLPENLKHAREGFETPEATAASSIKLSKGFSVGVIFFSSFIWKQSYYKDSFDAIGKSMF